ncbi:unnamed protein product [Caenorhabditis nigoni]
MRKGGRSKLTRRPSIHSAELASPSGRSGSSDVKSPSIPQKGSRSKPVRLRKVTSCDKNNLKLSGKDGVGKRRRNKKGSSEHEREKTRTSKELIRESAEKTADDENRPNEEKKPNPYDQIFALETKYKTDYEDMKKRKNDKKELRQSQIGSIFDPISGPSVPAVSGVNGVKNKMKWKIDVDPIELNGDQKMQEVLEKLKELRKNSGLKPCKVLKANEHMMSNSDDEPTEELIHMSARILQLVKMEALISKEISKEDQELLKGYCRCGDHKDKVESIFETITCSILEKVASKNEFIRHVSIPGQLRLFAVDEKRSKLPTMALMIVRKDLFYYAWNKQATPMDDEQLDQTWSSMTFKSFVVRQSAPLPPQPAYLKSAHFQPYY